MKLKNFAPRAPVARRYCVHVCGCTGTTVNINIVHIHGVKARFSPLSGGR